LHSREGDTFIRLALRWKFGCKDSVYWLRPRNRAPSRRPQRDRLDVTDADELLDRPLRNALELATSIFLLTSLRLLGLQKKNIQ
jgi:hypothetical protein